MEEQMPETQLPETGKKREATNSQAFWRILPITMLVTAVLIGIKVILERDPDGPDPMNVLVQYIVVCTIALGINALAIWRIMKNTSRRPRI